MIKRIAYIIIGLLVALIIIAEIMNGKLKLGQMIQSEKIKMTQNIDIQ